MTLLADGRTTDRAESSTPRAGMRLLIQMAEVLEDQAAGLYRRVATSEEAEFVLNREIEERQTEINRLSLKMEAMRAERERLLEKIASISEEANAIREEIFSSEEEDALAAIEAAVPEEIFSGEEEDALAAIEAAVPHQPCASDYDHTQAFTNPDPAGGSSFFRRMTISEQTPDL